MHRIPMAVLSALALIAGVFAVGCDDEGDPAPTSDGRLQVVATIPPIAALAREVGADLISLTVLAGVGVDPHEFEIKSDGRKAVDRAAVVLRNGIGIDAFLDKAIKGKLSKVVTVTDGLKLRTEGEGKDAEQDPHVWHSVENDKAMVDAIVAALSKADAANAEAFKRNGEAYKLKLDAVDIEIRKLIDTIPAANRKMVTNHDAFGYFIDRYGLTFVGAVIPNLTTQAEPSAKDIAALVETIKREKVKAIFAESSVDPKIAAQIAKDTNVKIVDDLYGDSLGEPGSGAESVDGMLLANAKKIVEALK